MNIETLTVKQICNYIAVINKMAEEKLIKFNPNKAYVQFNYDKVTKYLEKQNIEQKKQIEEYEKKLEIYENMRKETIEYIENSIEDGNYFENYIDTDMSKASYDKYVNSVDLLNILNKVGGSDE